MNLLEVVINLFVSGIGAASDLMARIGVKLVLAVLVLGVVFWLWYAV